MARLLRGRRRWPQTEQDEEDSDKNNNNNNNSNSQTIIKKGSTPPPLYHHDDDHGQLSESSDESSEDSDHWQPDTVATARSRRQPRKSARTARLTRGAAAAVPAPAVTVSRSPHSVTAGSKKSIHLTVKMSSSKLRQVTNSRNSRGTASGRHNIFTEDPVVHGKRSSRNTKNLKEVSEDEDEIDDEEDEVDDSEDALGEDDDELDADGDLDMEDATPQPPVSKRSTRPAAAAAKAKNKAVKSVEEKEMDLARNDEEDDEELSELDSDAEGEPDDTMLQDEEMGDAVEEEDEEEEREVEEEEEDELGSDEDDSSTPDLSKLTKRQRGSLGKDFLQLPMEPQVKKHLTAEEHAMRRAEMARRRKNLSEKRNEEEKMDTINRLLKKQAPKRRGRIPAAETVGEATPDVPVEYERPDPTMIRWVSGRDGCKVFVPDGMLGTPAARPFEGLPGGQLIEEV